MEVSQNKIFNNKRETAQSKELVDALQTHFYVSDPFELETEFHIDSIDNVGTLTQQPKQEIKNILTGLVRKQMRIIPILTVISQRHILWRRYRHLSM